MAIPKSVLNTKVKLTDDEEGTSSVMTLDKFLKENDGDDSVIDDVEEWVTKGMKKSLSFGGGAGPLFVLTKA